jgi:hypothetical protein
MDERFDYERQLQDEERRRREQEQPESWMADYDSWIAWCEETRNKKGD